MSSSVFSMYSIRTQTYLNKHSGEYDTILAIDRIPTESTPLRNIVKTLKVSPLSPYHYRNGISNPCDRGCIYALTHSTNIPQTGCGCRENEFMCISDLPILITLLRRWGYHVDSSMNSTNVRGMVGEDIVCYVSTGGESI